MLRLTVNNTPFRVPRGLTLLQALRRVGVPVPSACADDRLPACGACRLCLVRINGETRAVAACSAQVVDGMSVETHPADIERDRRTLLGMMARDLPREALERFPEKPFHRLLAQYGLESAMRGDAARVPADDSHPHLRVDLNRCIACFRCVRICALAQGRSVWRVRGRGEATRVIPDSGGALADSSCTGCGACSDTCPTGAIEDKSVLRFGAPASFTRSTCPYCGVGCETLVGVRDGRIVQILPVPDAPVNKGLLCVKGRYAFDFVRAADRVTSPMIRENGAWREVSWDEAMAFTAARLRGIVAEHGPDAVGVLGSSRATNEENYLTQKFARLVLGTNNVDCCARVCHAPTAVALKTMLGTGAATNSYDDIERAHTLLVCGANATESHPIVGKRILRAAMRGANLIVADPRRTELAEHATVHLALRPGTNVPLFNAMACVLVEEGLADADALRERIDGFEDFKKFIADFSPERVAPVCGVEPALIREAARLYATAKPAMCLHGLGMTEHRQGTEGVMALTNLALLTGNFGKPGTGMNPLRGQNNVQGSAHMGCEPGSLPGGVSLAAGREDFARVCGVPPPAAPGLNMMRMMDAAGAGKLQALWSIGYDIAFTNPGSEATAANLDRIGFVIVQDLFLNELARRHATVFLPAASSFEKDGTFMNAERRIQRVRKAIEPCGLAKSDAEIIALLAREMGFGDAFAHADASAVWDEIRSVWKGAAGISYERLDREGGLQWPCPSEDHPGTAMLHERTFPLGPRAALRRIVHTPTPEVTDDGFPFLLITGRCLYQFNAGTMTMRTPNVALRPTDTLDIGAADAERLGVRDGERVRLRSRHGATELPVRVSGTVKPGELFATFHDTAVFLNRVTGPVRDNLTDAPEYKVTAVRVEKLGP